MPWEFARYQPATPTHSMVATLSRIQNVPSMRLRMLSASSASCCAIPTANPAAHSESQPEIIPDPERGDTGDQRQNGPCSRTQESRHVCSSPELLA